MKTLKVRLKFKNGKFSGETPADEIRFGMFKESLNENSTLTVYFSVDDINSKTLPQLAKIHAMIKELSDYTGQDYTTIKEIIKMEANLTEIDETGKTILKSFSRCTREDLNTAIHKAEILGMSLNYVFEL